MLRLNAIKTAIAASVALAASAFAPAHAQGEADFYKGKTVRIIVGFSPGGGYDAYARMMAPYMAQRLGANVVVENQPGAGSITAMNNLYVAERWVLPRSWNRRACGLILKNSDTLARSAPRRGCGWCTRTFR